VCDVDRLAGGIDANHDASERMPDLRRRPRAAG
jgi:hypothetical protein